MSGTSVAGNHTFRCLSGLILCQTKFSHMLQRRICLAARQPHRPPLPMPLAPDSDVDVGLVAAEGDLSAVRDS